MREDIGLSSELPGTQTSLLQALEKDSREQNLIALGVFYERYRRGLARFLIARYRLDAQDANDILHDFLCEKMVDTSLIRSYLECVRQSKSGHRAFRPYLVRSLSNFTIDRLRKQTDLTIALSPTEDVLGSEYADLYTLQWAQDILVKTFQRTRSHYLDRDREQDWILFLARWIEPLLLGKQPPSYEQMAIDYDFDHAKQVGNVLTNVLRTFKQSWKEVLIEDVGTNSKQEMAEALRDARLSVRMATYIDFSQLLHQAMHKRKNSSMASNLNSIQVNEATYQGMLDLATDGFEELLPIEQSLLFESDLRSPLGLLLGTDFSLAIGETMAGKHFDQILSDPEPDPKCLELLAKELKKSIRGEAVGNIPASVAGVLRFALIALADAKCSHAITSIPTDQLAVAMSEVIDLPWIDERCCELMQTFLNSHSLSDSSIPA